MNAEKFIKKVDKIFGDPIEFTIEEPFIWKNHNSKIEIKFLPENFGLYVEITHEDKVYYYDFSNSYENEKFIKLEVVDDVLEKIDALVNKKEFDTKITIQLDLDKDILFSIMLLAHENNITLNEYIENILKKYIEE